MLDTKGKQHKNRKQKWSNTHREKSLNPASGNEGGKLTTSGCLMIDYAHTQDHNIGYTISFDTESQLTDDADSYKSAQFVLLHWDIVQQNG